MLIRLQKYLADAGIASRRAAEKLIAQGKIKVNNQIVTELGVKVDPLKDVVVCGHQLVKPAAALVYVMLNKPKGYVTAVKDRPKVRTVMELLPSDLKIKPVGRLDKNSQGLLIFTNDGRLIQELTHPKYKHEKEYLVTVDRPLDSGAIHSLRRGVKLGEGLASADRLVRVAPDQFRIVLHQGWKRQVRRMCEALGYKAVALIRIRVNKLKLGDLPLGRYKFINKTDII